jgi:aarF domain-containing kinase
MNVLSRSAFASRSAARSWTCSSCRSQLAGHKLAQSLSGRQFASGRAVSRGSGRQQQQQQQQNQNGFGRRILLYASSGAAAGISVLAFSDNIKSGYDTAERSGRVATVLALCINDYRAALNEREKVHDEEEKNNILNACHKRCAERTLKVLEKNGGIFIKLGQHLV